LSNIAITATIKYMKYVLKMFSYIPGERFRIVGLTVFAIVIGLINAGIPLVLRNLINNLSSALENNQFSSIYRGMALIVGLFITEQIITFYNEKISDTFRMQIITKIRFAVYPKILSLDLSYTEKHQPGAILQKINQGTGDFINWIFGLSAWTGTFISTTIFMLIVLWRQNIWLGIIFSVTIPLMVLASLRKIKIQKPYMKKANRQMEKYSGLMSETLSHFETIKTMSAESIVSKKFKLTNLKLKKNRLDQNKVIRKYNAIRDFIGTIGISLALITTIYLVTKKTLSIGDILLVSLYARSLTSSIGPLSYFLQDTSEVNYKSKRVIDFLETKPELEDLPGAQALDQLKSLEFDNVTFDYQDGKKGAVKNLTFQIGNGKTVALVGPSGVGKSTITKLIMRFYQPTKGQIRINDLTAEDYTQDSIRGQVGMVLQDVALFNSTILENLQIANSKTTLEEIYAAAKQAHAHEFIKDLPKGYDTLVGERGVKLSGGQKQRIAIARAILKDPQLIILDEATSALDSESERLVQDGLKKLMQGRSALVIAHRLSTVMHADEILVLEKGTIIERGTHHELMKLSGGLYKKLFEMQSSSGKVAL